MSDNRSARGTPAPSEAGTSRSDRTHRASSDAINALATHAGNESLKVGKPEFYYGDRDKFDLWVVQMDMYFLFNTMAENLKPVFATTFLRGRAQHWIKPFLRTYLDSNGQDNEAGIFTSYNHLKNAMKSVFGISNEVSTAVRVIQHLTQKTSAADYAAKFQEYAQITDWDDEALQVMFRRGLKDAVKDELMRDGRRVETMGELVKVVIDIDDKLYERALEKRYDSKSTGKAGYLPSKDNRPRNSNFNSYSNRPQRDDYGPRPMELDVTQQGRRFTGKGKGKPKNSRSMTCYACGKEGHIARNCHDKNKVHRAQFNMMQRKDDVVQGEISNEPTEPLEEYLMIEIAPTTGEPRTTTEPPSTLQRIRRLGKERDYLVDRLQEVLDKQRDLWNDYRATKDPESLRQYNEFVYYGIQISNQETNLERICEELLQKLEGREKPQKETRLIGMMARRVPYNIEKEQRHGHGSLHWRFCYDDACPTHRSSKIDAGFWPSTSSGSVQPPTPPESESAIVDEDNESDSGGKENKSPQENQEDSAEDSESEEASSENSEDDDTSESDEESNPEVLHFSVDAPAPMMKMIKYMARNFEYLFPQVHGKRYLNPTQLDAMFISIRAMFWTHRRIDVQYDFSTLITERIPIGSIITPHGYITPNNEVVTKEMRQAVRDLGEKYRYAQRSQSKHACNDTAREKQLAAMAQEAERKIRSWLSKEANKTQSGKGSTLRE